MATIERRVHVNSDGKQKTTYRVKVRLAAGRAEATFDKLATAKQWASQTETEIRNGQYFDKVLAREHTVAQAVESYLASPAFLQLDDQRNTEARVNWWKAKYGTLTLAQFGPDKIAEGRDKLTKAGKAPATVNRYLAAISRVLTRTIREQKWIASNPASRVDRLAEDNARDWALSADEQKALLAACKASRAPDLNLVVILALTTAARRSELLGLRWPDVDLKRGLVVFRDTKNGSTRSVPVAGPALDGLKAKSKVRNLKHDWVFPSAKDPAQPATFRQAWDLVVVKAGLDGFTFHGLRHTALSNLAMSGASLRELADVAGHKTLQMVKRYSHLTEQHTAEIVRRMVDKHLGGSAA